MKLLCSAVSYFNKKNKEQVLKLYSQIVLLFSIDMML